MRKLHEIVANTAKAVYREIIPVALFSIVSSLILVPVVFFLPLGLALALLPLVYMPLLLGVFDASHRMLEGEKGRVKHVLKGAAKHFGAGLVFGLGIALFALILYSSWWYYGSGKGMIAFGVAIFQTYFVAMVIVSQVYALPLVVQQKVGIFRAMGQSVKLFVSKPGYTFGVFFQLVSLTVILAVTVVGFAFQYAGIAGIYLNMATRNLFPEDEKEEEGVREPEWTLTDRSFGFAGKEA
ncbi:hypothetical protein J31TS4_20460 [Paenibacillus sp. J31TS4]|uniref:hypothetical protein n=1 Tax=Paenibacillus sp. J31TS4 TaxID=2807195 RepID=UPI001B0DDF12|nr:hypothetical protein [Paenibacillus sp. J31TS4]GIP38766.1 hypothetical protein J31TS4_20460 [Paenibacillus sp. J31TS4]